MRLGSLTFALALTAAACALATPAMAADANGKFAVRGIGSQGCETFTAAVTARQDIAPYAAWLVGYASAVNRATPQTFDVIPTQNGFDIAGVVNSICRDRKTLTVEAAAHEALRALAPIRLTRESPLVTVTSGNASFQVREEGLQILQAALIRRKLLSGVATGRTSAEFIKAVKDFQSKEKLAVTGLPDIDTFIRAIMKP